MKEILIYHLIYIFT